VGFLNPEKHNDNIVHNAGQDSSFQFFCAVKIAYDQYQQGARPYDNHAAQAQKMLTSLMAKAKINQAPAVVGTATHCLKCNHVDHNKEICQAKYAYCTKCCATDDHVTVLCYEWDDAYGRLRKVRYRNHRKAQAAKVAAQAQLTGQINRGGGFVGIGRGRGRLGLSSGTSGHQGTGDRGNANVAGRGGRRGRGCGRGD
jgi:hypothetical protein